MNNEITFLDPESGAEFHLEEFEEMKVYDGEVYAPTHIIDIVTPSMQWSR